MVLIADEKMTMGHRPKTVAPTNANKSLEKGIKIWYSIPRDRYVIHIIYCIMYVQIKTG